MAEYEIYFKESVNKTSVLSQERFKEDYPSH